MVVVDRIETFPAQTPLSSWTKSKRRLYIVNIGDLDNLDEFDNADETYSRAFGPDRYGRPLYEESSDEGYYDENSIVWLVTALQRFVEQIWCGSKLPEEFSFEDELQENRGYGATFPFMY